jgi:hypothetical protein
VDRSHRTTQHDSGPAGESSYYSTGGEGPHLPPRAEEGCMALPAGFPGGIEDDVHALAATITNMEKV